MKEVSLTNDIIQMIEEAEGKALATHTADYPHVVPVSTVKVIENKIILVNYFMGKTLSNILENSNVSLACWKGLEGVQVKAQVSYQTSGKIYDEIVLWVKEILPDRVVKGVLVLSPYEVYDVSVTATTPGERVL